MALFNLNKIDEKADNFVMSDNKILVQNTDRTESIDLFSRLKSMEVYDEDGTLLN